MRIAMTLLAVAGNFAATVVLMLSLSTAANIGVTTSASATDCDPRHYFCFPCGPHDSNAISDTKCQKGCCKLSDDVKKPE